MSEAKQKPRMNLAAALCFGLALMGIPLVVRLCWDSPPATPFGYAYLLIAFPTTAVGISGGIGALYGRLGLGLILGAALDFYLVCIGISLSIGGVI